MATTEQETAGFVGTSQLRKEDPELITGQGTYVDNIALPGMLWVGLVRSPFAHAKITSIDVSKALELEGVVAAYTGADLEFAAPLFMAWPINDQLKQPEHHPLAKDKARYVGDAVAVVVAESRALAKDAIELVEVDWEPLPAVVGIKEALEADAPLVHDELGTNDAGTLEHRGGLARAAARSVGAVLRRPRPGQDQGGVLPRPLDPERDRAARCRRRPERRHGRVHGLQLDPDPAHPADDARDHVRHPGGEAARGRAGRRRRLRLEARVLPGGRDLPRAREEARPPGEVGRGAVGELRRHPARARDVPADRARGDPRRRPQGGAGEADGLDGRVPAALSRRGSRCSAPGSTTAATSATATTSSTRTSSRTRRSPTPTAAPGGPRRPTRSSGRWTRSRASSTWTRSSCGGRTSSRRTSSPTTRSRAGSRSTRPTTRGRSSAASRCSTTTRSGPSRPSGASAATGSCSASASRPGSRCAASRPPACSRR